MYVNPDGKQGAFNEDKPHPGCFAQYRYSEKRQDFSVCSVLLFLMSRLITLLLSVLPTTPKPVLFVC